ncbi:hypothetical protein Z042_25495 [Chania multitudinisentens RB-25]|uniref:Uncharacterized protein n=1 Tax=Chania multitudinisentens RB-25 TaxID=1441930 RepID=A0A0D4ZY11_9GAMM|nr:hypothetical protein Z042_25495 [Chania multitudinisentens RB-25]
MFLSYCLISLFVMIGNFFIIRRLISSGNINHHVVAILISIIPVGFHMYIVKFGVIPLLGIDVFESDDFIYGALFFSIISGVPYAIAKRSIS